MKDGFAAVVLIQRPHKCSGCLVWQASRRIHASGCCSLSLRCWPAYCSPVQNSPGVALLPGLLGFSVPPEPAFRSFLGVFLPGSTPFLHAVHFCFSPCESCPGPQLPGERGILPWASITHLHVLHSSCSPSTSSF